MFNTVPLLGTLPDNVVSGLKAKGYHALWFENATLDRLDALLDHGWPIIVLLRAEDLPHGIAGLHAVVVIALTDEKIVFLDPMRTQATTMDVSDFFTHGQSLIVKGLLYGNDGIGRSSSFFLRRG